MLRYNVDLNIDQNKAILTNYIRSDFTLTDQEMHEFIELIDLIQDKDVANFSSLVLRCRCTNRTMMINLGHIDSLGTRTIVKSDSIIPVAILVGVILLTLFKLST